jgi:hypothetical protein
LFLIFLILVILNFLDLFISDLLLFFFVLKRLDLKGSHKIIIVVHHESLICITIVIVVETSEKGYILLVGLLIF